MTQDQTQQSDKDFWGDITAGGLLKFTDKLFTSDEERLAAETAKIDAETRYLEAKNTASSNPLASVDPMQIVLFGLGAAVLVGGGVMLYGSLKK